MPSLITTPVYVQYKVELSCCFWDCMCCHRVLPSSVSWLSASCLGLLLPVWTACLIPLSVTTEWMFFYYSSPASWVCFWVWILLVHIIETTRALSLSVLYLPNDHQVSEVYSFVSVAMLAIVTHVNHVIKQTTVGCFKCSVFQWNLLTDFPDKNRTMLKHWI